MKYYFYIENQARYDFFEKIIILEEESINCTFVVDLFSTYFYLNSVKKKPVLFFTTNKWQNFLCMILKINSSSLRKFPFKKKL